MSAAPDMAARMQAFRVRFVERARQDRAAIVAAWEAGDADALRRLCHGLAGNAGMFGFAEIGAAARAIEVAAEGRPAPLDEALLATLLRQLDQLERDPATTPE